MGSAAGVMGIAVSVVIGALQIRQGHEFKALQTGSPGNGSLPQDTANTVMPPPVARLPRRVRGRDQLIGSLSELATSPDGQVQVLAGLGGSGKSTIALKVAEAAKNAGRSVWWVSAVDEAAVAGQLLGLAHQLGAGDGAVQEALAGRLNPSDVLWRQLEVSSPWLLLFDNVDDITSLDVAGRHARNGDGWLRHTRSGLIVVTSRICDADVWQPVAQMHLVEPLDSANGAEVLIDLAPAGGSVDEGKVLSERLGGLPIALYQAGSYINSNFATERTFNSYRDALADRFEELLSHADDDRGRVTCTWEMTLDALAARGHGQARTMLRTLACFADGVPVPPSLLKFEKLDNAYGEIRANRELQALLTAGLISCIIGSQDNDKPSVTVHPLVSETVRHRAGDDLTESYAIAVNLFKVAVEGLDPANPKDWAEWLALLPHAKALLNLGLSVSGAALGALAWSAVQLTAAMKEGGSYSACLEVAEPAIRRIAGLGGDQAQVLSLRNDRAFALQFLGRFAEAEAEFLAVLQQRRRLLGPEHPDTLDTRHNFANSLAGQGDLVRAEAEWKEVFEARSRILGPAHRDTLVTWHDIAWVIGAQGKGEEAEAEFRRILEVISDTPGLGPEHRDALHIHDHIADVLAEQGKSVEAEAEFRYVFKAQQRVLTPDHPDLLDAWYGIAAALASQGKNREAAVELLQVLNARRRVLGPDHPATLATERLLAETSRSVDE